MLWNEYTYKILLIWQRVKDVELTWDVVVNCKTGYVPIVEIKKKNSNNA